MSDEAKPYKGGRKFYVEPTNEGPFDHVWLWTKYMPNYKGKLCRINSRIGDNVEVEFHDGTIAITNHFAVAPVAPDSTKRNLGRTAGDVGGA